MIILLPQRSHLRKICSFKYICLGTVTPQLSYEKNNFFIYVYVPFTSTRTQKAHWEYICLITAHHYFEHEWPSANIVHFHGDTVFLKWISTERFDNWGLGWNKHWNQLREDSKREYLVTSISLLLDIVVGSSGFSSMKSHTISWVHDSECFINYSITVPNST